MRLLAALLLVLPPTLQAEIITDGSVGAALSLSGSQVVIDESLGQVNGGNLLHSFRRFAVEPGQSVQFTTDSLLDNVIARVTGGTVSRIEGAVRLLPAAGKPSFFLINPSGIVVSGTGSFDVPGALHLSTADGVLLDDGSIIPAIASNGSLSIANPTAFGFLPGNNGDIVVSDNSFVGAPGAMVTVDAANVLVDNATISVDSGDGHRLRATAVGSGGGLVDLLNGLDTAAGSLVVSNNARLETRSSQNTRAADIVVQAGNTIIRDPGSMIAAVEDRLQADDTAAQISVTTNGNLTLFDGGRINADTTERATGGAGLISVVVSGRLHLLGPTSRITAINFENATGTGGLMSIQAQELLIEGVDATGQSLAVPDQYAGIETATTGAGGSGLLAIEVAGTIRIAGNAFIRSETFGSGDAGLIGISANNLLIDGIDGSQFTGITSGTRAGATGSGGLIGIAARGDIFLSNGGSIVSDTSSAGFAGIIGIDAAGTLRLESGALIGSDTFGEGTSGVVAINVGRLVIDGSGSDLFTGISSSALAGSGDAGFISMQGRSGIEVINGGQVTSSTQTSGKAGGIFTLQVSPEGELSGSITPVIVIRGSGPAGPSRIVAQASQSSTGRVGFLLLDAIDRIEVSDGGEVNIENFASATATESDTEVLALRAPVILLRDSPFAVTSASFGNLPGKPIGIEATRLLFLDDSRIVTETIDGNGGPIRIGAGHLFLQNSQISTSVTGTANGNGGDIELIAKTLILDTGFIAANTAAPTASGGLVLINAGNLFASSRSLLNGGDAAATFRRGATGLNVIQAAAPDGVSGEIVVEAPPTLDVTGSLLSLQAPPIGDVRIGRDPCEARGGSSLVATGRGGPPCNPVDPLGLAH